MFGKLQALMWGGGGDPHQNRDTWAELKTSALGPAEQMGDVIKEGFLEER